MLTELQLLAVGLLFHKSSGRPLYCYSRTEWGGKIHTPTLLINSFLHPFYFRFTDTPLHFSKQSGVKANSQRNVEAYATPSLEHH